MFGLVPHVLIVRVLSPLYNCICCVNAHIFSRNVWAHASVHTRTLSRNVYAWDYASIRARSSARILARTSVYLFVRAHTSASICARALTSIRSRDVCSVRLSLFLSDILYWNLVSNWSPEDVVAEVILSTSFTMIFDESLLEYSLIWSDKVWSYFSNFESIFSSWYAMISSMVSLNFASKLASTVMVNSNNGKKGGKYFSSSVGGENTLSPYIDKYWWGEQEEIHGQKY